MYLITTCASCAAPLEQTGTGVRVKQCSRCKTRYCSASCQRDHWKKRGGGHKTTCEKIAADGGAEMSYAMKKYVDALEDALKACNREEVPRAMCDADDRDDHSTLSNLTCYICKSRTDEGLVRGCACRGTEGFVHFTCLIRQARNAVKNKRESREAMWTRWHTCQECGQQFHGVVRHAIGWSCWMTYRDVSEGSELRCRAVDELGHGLFAVGRYEDALAAFAGAAKEWQAVPKETKSGHQQHVSQSLIAMCLSKLGRHGTPVINRKRLGKIAKPQSGLEMMNDALCTSPYYSAIDKRLQSIFFLRYAVCLLENNSVARAMKALIAASPEATRVLGEDHAIVIELDWRLSQAKYLSHFLGHDGYRNDLILSIKAHVEVIGRSSRVLGNHHPTTRAIAASLKLCFDEQLDWTLDDDVRKWLWVRRVLDGDFPPDPADFHFPPDPNDVTLDMMRQKVFLKRLNILDGDSDSDSDSEGVRTRTRKVFLKRLGLGLL